MRIQENMIEFNPISLKGRKALSRLISKMRQCNVDEPEVDKVNDEEYFLSNYYVEPFTRINDKNWSDECINVDDKDVYDVEVLRKSQKEFEDELNNNIIKLIWIHGNAGCGKSTYIHRLGQTHKNNIKISFYDFERVKKGCVIKKFKDQYIQESRIGSDKLWNESNCFRFLILLIDKIIDNLFINLLNDSKYLENLKAITNEHARYHDSENDFEYITLFFNYIMQTVCSETYNVGIDNIISFFNNIVDTYEDAQNSIENPSITMLLNILLQILLYKGNIENISQVCVFDNIEYISSFEYDNDRVLITDRTIEIILNSVHTAVNSYINKTLDYNYRYVPKIIVVTRKATVAFNGNLEGNNYQALEITNWFCAKEIYEKRYGLISKFVSDDERTAYKVFNLIMNDCTISKWSLVPFFTRMFNYNMRRMARILLHVLIINTTSSSRSEKDELNNFIKLWEENKSEKSVEKSQALRHFFRMYIIRLVLDSFNGYPVELGENQNRAYLNKLMVELGDIAPAEKLIIPNSGEDLLEFYTNRFDVIKNEKERNNKKDDYKAEVMANIQKIETSFTRKILTILHRTEVEDSYNEYNRSVMGVKYFDFEDLLRSLLLEGNTTNANTISTKHISAIGDILYLMNEVTDSTGWVPLTSVKWKNTEEKYTLSAINKVLENALQNIQSQQFEHSCGIRITYAGQTFLKLLPEFEYFAARFCPLDPKLLSNRSLIKASDGFGCIKTINKVLYYSVKCIYVIIKRAEIEYASLGEGATIDFERMHNSKSIYKEARRSTQIMHPLRIFNQQISYLNIFREYVLSLEPNETRFKNDDEKNELLQEIDNAINEYLNWEKYFKETYSNFLLKGNN